MTSDHPEQSLRFPFDGAFDPLKAPMLLAFRKQRDAATVAAPDWTFWDYPMLPAKMPGIDE